jgi:hypothetical protein
MEQLNEYKCRVIGEIDSSPTKSLSLGTLLGFDRKHKDGMQRCLDFLEKENYVTKEMINGFSFYSIKDGNAKVPIMKVICPKCQTIRNVYYPGQIVTVCINTNCKSALGKRTRIFLRPIKMSYDMTKVLHLFKE